ncbi:MAG: T9SS type A sorting domain-containing protein, partial [Candidatus Paceibacterota bacterium]
RRRAGALAGRRLQEDQVFNQRKQGTTTNYPDAIDHQMVSNKLKQKWIFDQTYRLDLPSYIDNYSNTTSDHYPVFSLFNTYSLSAKEMMINQVELLNFIPNPSSDKIVFKEDIDLNNIEILNYFGQNMYGKFEVLDKVIFIQNLPVGIYWIVIKNQSISFKKKLIIVR